MGLCAAVGRCLFFVLKDLGSGKEAVLFEANHVFIDAKGAYWIVNSLSYELFGSNSRDQ